MFSYQTKNRKPKNTIIRKLATQKKNTGLPNNKKRKLGYQTTPQKTNTPSQTKKKNRFQQENIQKNKKQKTMQRPSQKPIPPPPPRFPATAFVSSMDSLTFSRASAVSSGGLGEKEEGMKKKRRFGFLGTY